MLLVQWALLSPQMTRDCVTNVALLSTHVIVDVGPCLLLGCLLTPVHPLLVSLDIILMVSIV